MKNLLLLCLLVGMGSLFAQTKPVKYVGAKRCKVCHNKVEKGQQYTLWSQNAHAHAYESLLSEASQKIAAQKGLTAAPEASPECLRCHVTGWGEAGGYVLNVDPANARAVKTNQSLASVGCECCHGPGNAYKSKKAMLQIRKGSQDGTALGFTEITEATCTRCHNSESPTYKPFDFEKRRQEIAHLIP